MIKISKTSVMNMENAMRGARNPLNSWNRMDSRYDEDGNFILGENDRNLARRLVRAGKAACSGRKRPSEVHPPDLCQRGHRSADLLVERI